MKSTALFEYLLRLGDDRLVLGHRLSEWCGHGPMLEEDIALANIALDCIGHAQALLHLASEVEGSGRSEDDLVYFREAVEYRNVQLVELPRGDFAMTIARQYFFDVYSYFLYTELCRSRFQPLADIAAKALKEITYHVRHSGEWMLRLGDGTQESHARLQAAVNELWRFTDELFTSDALENQLHAEGISPKLSTIQDKWRALVSETLTKATLTIPAEQPYKVNGSRQGKHSEHLGYLLSEMQILQRSYPNCQW